MRTSRTIVGAFLLVTANGASLSNAAEIRGSVVVGGDEPKAPTRYVIRGQRPGRAADQSSGGLVAICLGPIDTKPPIHVPDTPFVMAQANTSFAPNLLAVPVGAKVTFPNHDAFFHNVFSYSPPRSFDLGRYPQGETRTVKFEEPGIVRIFCEIHSSMYAAILVAPSDHYQVIEKSEGFSFPDLPAGRYRVCALDAVGRRAVAELQLENAETKELSLALE